MTDVTRELEDLGPSNWGRWGEDDQRGTLNLLTPEHIVAAASLIRRGVVISLAAPVGPDGPVVPTRDRTWHLVRHRVGPVFGGADDVVIMHTHASTHIDSLAHSIVRGEMYNGFPAGEHISSRSVERNAITNVGAIVGRGVLLDLASHRGVNHLELGEVVMPDELDDCARAQGVSLGRGDVCLVRTGWYRLFLSDRDRFDEGEPGLSHRAAGWFHDLELVALGADTCAVDVVPSEDGLGPYPLHPRIINRQGGYLIEYLDLEELAATGVHEFLFVAAPLRITGGAGSPINPLAIC
jgi:kynurenine formamidase